MHNIHIPTNYSYSKRRGFEIHNAVHRADSRDIKVFNYSTVRFGWSFVYQNRTYADAATLRRFYLARNGPLSSFLLTDPEYCSTAADGFSMYAGDDQPVIQIGSQYFLAKQIGGGLYHRIRRPDDSEIIFFDDGDDVTEDVTVNETTGEVTGYAPEGEFTWGGYFDIPVRFEGDFHTVWNGENAIDINLQLLETFND